MEKKKTIGKRELILLAVLLTLGGLGILFLSLRPAVLNGQVEITVDGTVFQTLPLAEDATVTIPGADGGENVLVIESGKAYMKSASCPDGICVRHYAVSKDGESIICLPNKVVVTVRGGEKGDVDAIA